MEENLPTPSKVVCGADDDDDAVLSMYGYELILYDIKLDEL